MQKIFSVDKVRLADLFTIENEPIKSIDLMERASEACAAWLIKRSTKENTYAIFCGPGNNGGDGLALARLLNNHGFGVRVFILKASKYSEDFLINQNRLINSESIDVNIIDSETDFPLVTESEIIIDALFGSGLSKPLEKIAAKLIGYLNKQRSLSIAIDIPSGLFADRSSITKDAVIFKADYTLSFQFPKLAFFMAENDLFVGDWQVLDIGLSSEYIHQTKTSYYFLDLLSAVELIRPRPKYSHKGSYGHGLLIAGSNNKMGAAILACKSALRSGAGLITLHHPKGAKSILPAAVPEVMSSLDENEEMWSNLPSLTPYSAIAVGPGIGTFKPCQKALKLLIQETKLPLVIDADALNILSENKTWLSFLPAHSILTPHPKEFERLVGKSKNDFDCLERQLAFAEKYKVFLILKGAHTRIATPNGQVFFNSSGNPGMATAGAGDVLTGILLGLKAQAYTSMDACILGVFIHGLAGDFAAENKGQISLISSDIIDSIPEGFISLLGK